MQQQILLLEQVWWVINEDHITDTNERIYSILFILRLPMVTQAATQLGFSVMGHPRTLMLRSVDGKTCRLFWLASTPSSSVRMGFAYKRKLRRWVIRGSFFFFRVELWQPDSWQGNRKGVKISGPGLHVRDWGWHWLIRPVPKKPHWHRELRKTLWRSRQVSKKGDE